MSFSVTTVFVHADIPYLVSTCAILRDFLKVVGNFSSIYIPPGQKKLPKIPVLELADCS